MAVEIDTWLRKNRYSNWETTSTQIDKTHKIKGTNLELTLQININ